MSESVQQALQRVFQLPGALYCGVVDQLTGEVLVDIATKSPFTTELVEWAAAVAALLNASRMPELDDIMVTSRDSYHLVRRVALPGRRPVLVVLALDRGRSNLAVARRELAVSRWPDLRISASPLRHRLPRRSDPARDTRRWPPPPAPRPPEPAEPTVLRQRWANDVGTMRQLLVGLRALR